MRRPSEIELAVTQVRKRRIGAVIQLKSVSVLMSFMVIRGWSLLLVVRMTVGMSRFKKSDDPGRSHSQEQRGREF